MPTFDRKILPLPILMCSAVGAALIAAPAVSAAPPECTDVGISTRLCTRGPGHTAITTSPNPAFTNPGPGWGFGTLGIPAFGLGGGGFWIGI